MKRGALRQRGFTLLEVMVAVAILGLGLTAILSAQAGAFAASGHARNLSMSLGLARCKMTEVEEKLQKEGFQELDTVESGICCEGDETPGVRCNWKVEKPLLPEAKLGDLNLNASLGSGLGSGDMSALGAVLGGNAPAVGSNASVGDVAKSFAGAAQGSGDIAGLATGGVSAIASLVMSMVYPNLKLIFEASTRRVTVDVLWTEGQKEYSVQLSQWVVSPQKAGVMPEELIDALNPGGIPSAGTPLPPPGQQRSK